MTGFYKKIKELRISHGYTQETLAQKLHCSVSTVGLWEQNRRIPSTQYLIDLAILFQLPLNDLIGIPREATLAIDRLTENQQKLMLAVAKELRSRHGYQNALSREQLNLVSALIHEFTRI